ncbi:hypothetical protein [Mesorhizobium sp.]|uniref:hypothetical protein n=1 Tax=Mesorhizobium sp. TaxID=1871066 RepID=UPI0025B9BFA8|nr:hypothetical protein [Mesorhizobium sp.]
MRAEGIWPNGLRYLWTDAFGVVLYVSLYKDLGEEHWLGEAERLVADVERVLGRPRGLRIGEAADRDGQYFHYLAMWLFALARLGDLKPQYRARGVALARDIHPAFVIPGRGVIWKMQEDLSSPYPGYGLGSMDAYDGYVSYRMLDEDALAPEIAQMRDLMERDWRTLDIEQDLGLGMMLWLPRRAMGQSADETFAAEFGNDVGRPAGLFQPRAVAARYEVRLHQLRRVAGPAGRRRLARAYREVEHFLRELALRRRIRSRGDHLGDGLHLASSRCVCVFRTAKQQLKTVNPERFRAGAGCRWRCLETHGTPVKWPFFVENWEAVGWRQPPLRTIPRSRDRSMPRPLSWAPGLSGSRRRFAFARPVGR